MTTTQQSRPARKSGGSAAAKNAAAAQKAKQEPKKDPATKPKAKKETAPAQPTYRDTEGFTDALKSAKSAAKGNEGLVQALQLITHLGWKTPGGSVGWAKGTTQAVVDFATDIAAPAGTPIPDAMSAALGAAEKSAADKPQKDAVAALSKVIRAHNG